MSLQSFIDCPKDLIELINDCLKPKIIEKKENGEVFTPLEIINELLDKIPKEVWNNKKLKWFDPASGMGNFQVAIYLRLMEGLQREIPDDKLRKKHILENMLYMSELNKKNVYVFNQIFNINNEYNLNIFIGDTLNLIPEEHFGIKKFDIIIGNPPYNKGGIWSHTKQMNSEDRKVIWPDFVKKSFECLKENGYLLFITPLYWLKINNEVHDLMLEKYVMWLKLWDNSQSKKMINADIPISLYLIKNIINDNEKTEIVSIMKRRNLNTKSIEFLDQNKSIPLAFHSIFNKLSNFIEKNNLKLEYNTKTIKSSGKNFKIPNNYSVKDNLAVDTYKLKEGLLVKKVTDKHPDMEKRKLILSNKSSFRGIFIDDGKLSITGCNKYYILGDNLELLLKMFNFKIMNVISHFTKYTQDFIDKEAFKYIPDIRKLNIKDITEKEFYNLLKLSEEEIKDINLL